MAEFRQTALGTVVQKIQIIGTPILVFSAWRFVDSLGAGCERFTSLTSMGNQWLGQIGHQVLPAELDALPAMSDVRSQAVRQWHQRMYEWAYQEILSVFPEAADPSGYRDMGEITVRVPVAPEPRPVTSEAYAREYASLAPLDPRD